MKSDMLEFALMLARAAEAEIMPRFKKCAVSWKPDGSEVTEADRRAEEVMRDLISKHSPATAVHEAIRRSLFGCSIRLTALPRLHWGSRFSALLSGTWRMVNRK